MDFGSVEEQLSREFLIGCMFFFFFFILLRAIHPLFDSRLLIDCQWFFETAGESDRQSEQHSSHSNCFFLSMVRDKVHLKKAGLDFWKVGVRIFGMSNLGRYL